MAHGSQSDIATLLVSQRSGQNRVDILALNAFFGGNKQVVTVLQADLCKADRGQNGDITCRLSGPFVALDAWTRKMAPGFNLPPGGRDQ
jgi:hypothetical protein